MLTTHTHTPACPDSGPCFLFPLATEVQHFRKLLDKTNIRPNSSASLNSLFYSQTFSPVCLSFPSPSLVLSSNFNLSHLSFALFFSSFLLATSPPFRMPAQGPVRTLTRLSASLNTHHSPCFIVHPDSFCTSGEKATSSLLTPPSLHPSKLTDSPVLFSLPSHLYSPLPSALMTSGPHTHTHADRHTHSTFIKVKGCSCLNKEIGGVRGRGGG